MTKQMFGILTIALFWISYANSEDRIDLQSANVAIAADIVMNASPKTRSRCSETPCLGVSQAELGLALIAARDTPASKKTLAELIRFRMDGSLGEEFACVVLRKGKTMRKWFAASSASHLSERCVSDYDAVTRAHTSNFPPAEVGLLCRKTEEISAVRREILEMLDSKRARPF